jgi:hypothetical protein
VRFYGWVEDSGGGQVEIVVDRDTLQYPAVGSRVRVDTIVESSEIVAAARALIENTWYSKDPKWWAAVDRGSYEALKAALHRSDDKDA